MVADSHIHIQTHLLLWLLSTDRWIDVEEKGVLLQLSPEVEEIVDCFVGLLVMVERVLSLSNTLTHYCGHPGNLTCRGSYDIRSSTSEWGSRGISTFGLGYWGTLASRSRSSCARAAGLP